RRSRSPMGRHCGRDLSPPRRALGPAHRRLAACGNPVADRSPACLERAPRRMTERSGDMENTELALLLVDIQRDFWGPLADVPPFASFPANVSTLLETARANHLPVVHTQAVFKPDGTDWMLFYRPQGRGRIPCIAGSDGVALEGFAAPQDGEPVVRK